MIREIVLPQLAMGMSEGTIVEWLVPEGGHVDREEPLVSIETEKVVTELPAPYKGYLHIVADLQTTLPVETLIAQIATTKEEYETIAESVDSLELSEPEQENNEAMEASVDLTVPHVSIPAKKSGRTKASGLAKSVAGLAGIDLAEITGTGPGGRIVRRDVDAAIGARPTGQQVTGLPMTVGSELGRREKARIPLTGMRGAVAERMMQAKLNTAQTYVFFEIDVTKLLAARKTMVDRADELGVRVSMVALYAKALSIACHQVPICNATLEGNEITLWDNVDISVAVATQGKGEYDSGLLVPVLRNVEAKSVLQISTELKNLVERAHAGKLGGSDMSGHTVTLTSTGGLSTRGSWLVSAPILNMPAVTAFQPGTPKRTPIVSDNDEIEIRDILPCGLTFDHRAVDGEPVGVFIKKITDLLSNPELMLL